MSRAILVVGQSHVAAIRAAAKARREADPEAPRTRVIHLGEARYAPELVEEDGRIRFAAPLATELDAQVARHAPLVASCIGGNVHNVLALLRHPRPFDFRLSGEDDPEPPDPAAEPIPESLVRAALEAAMATDLARLALLADRVAPLVHLQSPPPLADAAWIAARADAFFRERGLEARGVAPRGLRRRMWRLQSRITAEACAKAGIGYLDVPRETLDAEGFLDPRFAGDATHGNARYGEAWIARLEALP